MEPEALDQAFEEILSGPYKQIVTTGGPIDYWPGSIGPATFAERAADYLRSKRPKVTVIAVPAPSSSIHQTYLSGVMVREWARRSGITVKSLDVFSAGTHARPSRPLYKLVFGPNVRVGVFAARNFTYDPNAWWHTTTGARAVLDEAIRLFWVKCCFWPPAPESL